MEISYTIYNPTRNITLLVSSPVPRSQHAAVAERLMGRFSTVEQVGFLERPGTPAARLRLQMMGGEFCGNATMSAAAYLAERDGLAIGAAADYPLEVSGYDGVLSGHLKREVDHFQGTVSMPLPKTISSAALPPLRDGRTLRVPAVWFPGIVHCIVPAEQLDRQSVERDLRPQLGRLCQRLQSDACGILLFDRSALSFTPLVYVADTGTAVWESGCGSGSAAIGAYLAFQGREDRETALAQPGGTIRVCAGWTEGRFTALTITGEVRVERRGTVVL